MSPTPTRSPHKVRPNHSLASWRRLDAGSESLRTYIIKPTAVLIVLVCGVCNQSTVTRHYAAFREKGWEFDDPPAEAFDYHRIKGKCPICNPSGVVPTRRQSLSPAPCPEGSGSLPDC